MQYFVYAIGKKESLKEPYDYCYIGVTNRPEKRWKSHLKSRYTIGSFIRENNLTYEENMIIIMCGSSEECFEIEKKYRPFPNMYLNEAIGGHGGYTSYTEKRNKIISEKLKGRDTSSWKHKMIETKNKNKSHSGSKNIKAKKWILISPTGKEIKIHGNLNETCEKLNLLPSCLSYYRGKIVPSLKVSYGGYRAKNENSLFLRKNTSGWMLIENDGD